MKVQWIGYGEAVLERGGHWAVGEVREVTDLLGEYLTTNPFFSRVADAPAEKSVKAKAL